MPLDASRRLRLDHDVNRQLVCRAFLIESRGSCLNMVGGGKELLIHMPTVKAATHFPLEHDKCYATRH